MKATPIPQRARDQVRSRARSRCERCLVPAPTGHWHHRRSRSIRDLHTHCPCNGVWLCPTCHRWAHDHPTEAREDGWIVSRGMWPWLSPFRTPLGWVLTECDGTWKPAL